jgi:hypothetical protein
LWQDAQQRSWHVDMQTACTPTMNHLYDPQKCVCTAQLYFSPDEADVKCIAPVQHFPSVDIYIVAYNEPVEVVEPTTIAAMNLDWPGEKLTVYVLDDGKNELLRNMAMKYVVASMAMKYVSGNLAMMYVGGSLAMTYVGGNLAMTYVVGNLACRMSVATWQ